jgi:hypothetical protein
MTHKPRCVSAPPGASAAHPALIPPYGRRSKIYEEAFWALDNLHRLVDTSGGVRLELL